MDQKKMQFKKDKNTSLITLPQKKIFLNIFLIMTQIKFA
jgi:hypothetical protein